MYGIKDDMNFLIGRQILHAARKGFQVDLTLEGNIEIVVESEITIDSIPFDVDEPAERGKVTGARIRGAIVQDANALILQLSTGHTLAIKDSNVDLESFTISAPGKTIVV